MSLPGYDSAAPLVPAAEPVAQPHHRRVEAIRAQVRALANAGDHAHIDKGGVHHVVPLPGDRRFSARSIDTSALTNILHVDVEARICIAEPGVTFESLVRHTLPLGLAPAVVPELRGITLGGAVAGCSLESMSFRYGGFHEMALEYEVIGGDGELHRLSKTSRPDLFEHVHGSYGTLGILTEITFQLIAAKPAVALTYRQCTSFEEFSHALTEVCELDEHGEPRGGFAFVDGIIHGPDHLTLCLGNFADPEAGTDLSSYQGEKIYYQSTRRRTTDLVSTEEYFFRYDTECHWLTATVPPLEWKPVRKALGRWFLGSTNLISWSNRTAKIQRLIKRRPDLVCDVFLPENRFKEFWDWYCVVFDFWPLWIVPYRPASTYPWLGPHVTSGYEPGALFIDAAVYGKVNTEPSRDYSVLLEEKVFELGGLKTLIGRNHYSRDQFWQVYHRDNYVSAKAALDPHGLFPDLYDKLGRVD